MTNLPEHVEQSLQTRGLLRDCECVLVALSGGLDSTVLLHLLHGLSARHRWQLGVAHLNHQLRGRSSGADERFVRRLARKLGLPVVVERAEVRVFAREGGLSVEMAARKLRHEFLARAAQQAGARRIVLAHHEDDQVELFFLRLFRGAGGEGFGGMKWRSASPANPRLELVRPLLDVPRASLREFAEARRISWREDASNASVDLLRNRVRHELLPLLVRHYQPALAATVTRAMRLVGEESAFVRETASVWLRGMGPPPFARLAPAVQRAVVLLQLRKLGLAPDYDLIEQLRGAPGCVVTVKPDFRVVRSPHGAVSVRAGQSAGFQMTAFHGELRGQGGEMQFGGLRIRWAVTGQAGDRRAKPGAGREVFDADAVGPVVTLRHWRPGDRFQPIGLGRSVKLQDLFTNARVPAGQRRERVVAETADGRIFWVEGLRIGEPGKLTPGTIRRLQWRWQRL